MSQPVTYTLHDPFFVSSRLSPAVTVADATIHLRAHAVDRDEPHEVRVVWEYIIETPSMVHAGRDLTTPYPGAGRVAEQLPTAMGTLLDYLGHVAHGDDRDSDAPPLPHPVLRWARANHDQIAAVADLVAARVGQTPTTSDPDQGPGALIAATTRQPARPFPRIDATPTAQPGSAAVSASDTGTQPPRPLTPTKRKGRIRDVRSSC